MCKINLNQELNGIELSFESKPERATLDAIKAHGFKWNGRKMVWYAKQTADRLTFAESLGEIENIPQPDRINLDNLSTENKAALRLYGADLAAAIREDLKKRGAKGVTIRARKSTHDDAITVTIKATPEDFASVEEFENRYSFGEFSCDISTHGRYTGERWIYNNEFEQMTEEEQRNEYRNYIIYNLKKGGEFSNYHQERNNYPDYTTAFYDKVLAVFKIANQFNYDHSDSMTDYFDVGYYLDVVVKKPEFEPREKMTEAERTAYDEEIAKEEAERAARLAQYQKEQEEAKKEAEERAKADKAAEELIYNNIIVEDLEEDEQIYINNCAGDGGKACNLEEVKKDLHIYNIDCVIDRKVIFASEEAYNEYCNRLMYDYIFLYGKGGTGSEDVRLEGVKSIYNLTTAQRESIKWYQCKCVGVYLNNNLMFVVDPQGYNYSRYVYMLTEDSETTSAADTLKEQENDSQSKPAFYFPAKVEEQAAQLHEGQAITIYQGDGWLLNSIYAGSGVVTGFYMGSWAQYNGLFIELMNGRKTKTVFIHDNKDCLIYEGIKDKLPDEITREQISNNMYEMFNTDKLITNTYNYYLSQGEQPIIDTCYR